MSDALLRTARANIRRFVAIADFKCGPDKTAALNCLDVIEESLDGLSDTLTVTRDAFAASDKVRAAHIERIEAVNAELVKHLQWIVTIEQGLPQQWIPPAIMRGALAALASATPATEGTTP